MVAVVVFLYQTLDALDGKHSNLLGLKHQVLEEYADHACDSISNVCLCIQVSIVLRLGATYPWFILALVIGGMTIFYGCHWQVYTSGVVKFGL